MLRQGNKKANSYYAATLGNGPHETLRKPPANAAKLVYSYSQIISLVIIFIEKPQPLKSTPGI